MNSVTIKHGSFIPFFMPITWLNFEVILLDFFFGGGALFFKISDDVCVQGPTVAIS